MNNKVQLYELGHTFLEEGLMKVKKYVDLAGDGYILTVKMYPQEIPTYPGKLEYSEVHSAMLQNALISDDIIHHPNHIRLYVNPIDGDKRYEFEQESPNKTDLWTLTVHCDADNNMINIAFNASTQEVIHEGTIGYLKDLMSAKRSMWNAQLASEQLDILSIPETVVEEAAASIARYQLFLDTVFFANYPYWHRRGE